MEKRRHIIKRNSILKFYRSESGRRCSMTLQKKIFFSLLFFFFIILFSNSNTSFADDDKDIFSDYHTDIQKPADAKATNVYNAWGDNMAKLIESGYRDGVVIDGPGEYAGGKVYADGAGNVIVRKDAHVGPIINKPKFENTNIIIKRDSNNNFAITNNQKK